MGKIKSYVRAALERDPAADSAFEVLLCYPGIHALINHRLAHFLFNHKFKLLARLVSQTSRFFTGIEIHPGAKIGNGVFIDHGMGVVIGETAVVGNNVTIYHGVTLGGTGKDTGKRHPNIDENVVISTGAKILGPFTVGRDSKIGAGSVVLKEVPPDSTVVGIPGHVVKKGSFRVVQTKAIDLDQIHMPDPIEEEIQALFCKVRQLDEKVRELEGKLREKEAIQ